MEHTEIVKNGIRERLITERMNYRTRVDRLKPYNNDDVEQLLARIGLIDQYLLTGWYYSTAIQIHSTLFTGEETFHFVCGLSLSTTNTSPDIIKKVIKEMKQSGWNRSSYCQEKTTRTVYYAFSKIINEKTLYIRFVFSMKEEYCHCRHVQIGVETVPKYEIICDPIQEVE